MRRKGKLFDPIIKTSFSQREDSQIRSSQKRGREMDKQKNLKPEDIQRTGRYRQKKNQIQIFKT